MVKYEFSNSEYEKEHGKSPRGTGHWAFILEDAAVEGIAPEAYIERVSATQQDTIFWVPGVWTLKEAKRRATFLLAARAVPSGITVYVAP